MSIIVDWKIKPRSGVCSHSDKEFEDEEPFYTCIFDDPESDGFIRRDYSVESWNAISKKLEPSPFSFWKSHYKKQENKAKEDAVKQNSAEAMLHRMIEEDQPVTENARYILALMLERKKILIPTEVKETDTRRRLFYEHKDTGSVYIVSDPMLKLDEIRKRSLSCSKQRKKEAQPLSRKVRNPLVKWPGKAMPTTPMPNKLNRIQRKPKRRLKALTKSQELRGLYSTHVFIAL
ncbi:MAG: hypothetical protein P1V20_30525 [Verrucomicrobiales bacterium]|nr:hypothetical protein [Verrucomicrobiales bacterium]